MIVTRTRGNVLTLSATTHELSVLVAGARMALWIMRSDPQTPPEARDALARVIADYEDALNRIDEGAVTCTS